VKIWIKHWLFFQQQQTLCPCPCFATLYWCVANVQFLYLLFFSVTVGWLEEGVPHDTGHHSNSVKKIGKVMARPFESVDHILVIRGKGSPLEYARDAGKNRGGKRVWGYALLHYRPTRYLGGDDRCHATNLHEVGDSRDVCHVIPFMCVRLVTRQQMKG